MYLSLFTFLVARVHYEVSHQMAHRVEFLKDKMRSVPSNKSQSKVSKIESFSANAVRNHIL